MQRFFVPPEIIPDVGARLTASLHSEIAHQITRVLRMRVGDEVLLLDGRGYEYTARLTRFEKDQVLAEVLERQLGKGEPSHSVTGYISLLNKPEKFEWALQKCTELGAARFVPIVAERSVTAPPGPTKRERWERIIREAAEQSGRCMLPVLADAVPFDEAVRAEGERLAAPKPCRHTALIPALGARRTLPNALQEAQSVQTVSIFIGPEGGFTDREVSSAAEHGITTVSLGPRTLRAETAAVAALTLVMSALGEIG